MTMPRYLVQFALLSLVSVWILSEARAQHIHGVADPARHPYADPNGGRDAYRLSDAAVNEARLYDFYARQADYHMAAGDLPRVLPAHPGLDAGQHGHWGKHNQNSHEDGRWNDQDSGPMVGARLHEGDTVVHKAINVKLGNDEAVSACFDPWTLTYRYVWTGGFVEYHPYRWGVSRGVRRVGQEMFQHDGRWTGNDPAERVSGSRYRGVLRDGRRVFFSYELNGVEVLDHPWAMRAKQQSVFTRTLRLTSRTGGEIELPVAQLPPDADRIGSTATGVVVKEGNRSWAVGLQRADAADAVSLVHSADGAVKLSVASSSEAKPIDVRLSLWSGKAESLTLSDILAADSSVPEMPDHSDPKPLWPDVITLDSPRSNDDRPYVVDTIPVPFDNKYKSVMMFSGIDFLPNGDALISTLSGDVWIVGGLDGEHDQVTWKRFATGLSQPFGIKFRDGRIFVLAKDRLHILHDRNGDREADYYENYDNSWLEPYSHTHTFGLDCDRDGNFYFPAYDLYYKLPPDGSGVELFAKGFRNCMGAAVSDDGLVLAAPQEGTWTPASMIIEVRRGEHYGFKRTNEPIAPPMCFIPRGIDNSTGGMVFVDSDRWGPLGKSLIGLSYGYGSHYLILRDETTRRLQCAVVPLEGEFLSGVVRGRVNPKDGQFYVVGTDGWGNYALDDGCLHRIRYTGRPIHKPIGFRMHRNGIRINFTSPLDSVAAANAGNYLVQQWDYEYGKRYGSPEFSTRRKFQIGHDVVSVRSVQVLSGGKSIFIEMPKLLPSSQLYVRMHLKAQDGTEFKESLFATAMDLGEHFSFEGAKPPTEKLSVWKLRVRENKSLPVKYDDPNLKVKRTIRIQTAPGLQYDKTTITAGPGEPIAIELKNVDGMPHNFVLVQPGAYEKVGMASFSMLNDPAAFEKHYVPDMPEIVAHTRVVFPGEAHKIKFKAPTEPGRYPFLCTFPGHWQTMTGQLIVGDVSAGQDPGRLTILEQTLLKEPAETLAADARKHGDAERGKKLFFHAKVGCANCHELPRGLRLGPDLKLRREGVTDAQLVESVLSPSRFIREDYRSVMVMTIDGKMQAGYFVSENDKTITLRDTAPPGRIHRLNHDDIEQLMKLPTSTMPAGLVNQLSTRGEFLDLLCFVMELQDSGKQVNDDDPLRMFRRENLFGWSIMAFDAARRGPKERCAAVKRLGLGGYGIVPFTYRFERVLTADELDAELGAMKEAGLEVQTIWADRLNPQEPLGTDLENLHLTGLVVEALKRNNTKADVWFWMRDSYLKNFDQLTDVQRTTKIAAAVDQIAAEIEPLGGRVGLYNHGGWLGEIENQLKVLKAMKQQNAGIALNLHHGGPSPNRVSKIIEQAGDRLLAIVLNGHNADGKPRGIQPFGSHDADLGTLRAIIDSGFTGSIGLLDHNFESDTETRLSRSADGLDRILNEMRKDNR